MSRPLTPPSPSSSPQLVLCADGGGSKVCVVIRSSDGVEVRGTAGPCNVLSVGYDNAAEAILLATYRALSHLPSSHFPSGLNIPDLDGFDESAAPSLRASTVSLPALQKMTSTSITSDLITPQPSRNTSPVHGPYLLPPLNRPVFQYVWLALAGISTPADCEMFAPYAVERLNVSVQSVKVTNDVNLLAAPALDASNIKYVAAVVSGTGTVGRTIRVGHSSKQGKRSLPLEDVGVSRGWGFTLCDEGSAFWLGRSAVRLLLAHTDREASSSIFSSPPPRLLPFHEDLMMYFGADKPMDLIDLMSFTGAWIADGFGPSDIGRISARRNALLAGSARIVLEWAFRERGAQRGGLDGQALEDIEESHRQALDMAIQSIQPLVTLTLNLLGDRTIVNPGETVLALGGGLMQSKGFRELLLKGLESHGISDWGMVTVIDDAAGVGALGLAKVQFPDHP